ncbi:hypothetical protein [Dyella terrae]|uniref:hypothetical protein n=1 Tax=Dyella terrae TaxID=522259 RepID=UPI001EFDEF58|nr:hypothetical protein [Dyella terrae]ULU26589.1 hypothetical protein DYST_03535 [Dyella terrae]
MYQPGTANSPSLLLQALATFAGNAGWAIDLSNNTSGDDWTLAMHKGSCFLWWRANAGNINIQGATGYTAGQPVGSQPNVSPVGTANPGVGPYASYQFFTDPNNTYLHVVVERVAGVFLHIHAGQLNTVGGAAPCTYFQTTQWDFSGTWGSVPDIGGNYVPWSQASTSGFVGATVDGTFYWFGPGRPSPTRALMPVQRAGTQHRGWSRTPNQFNALAPFFTLPIFLERASGGTYSYVGDVPDVRLVNMSYINAGDEIVIGADTWRVLPACSKGPTSGTINSPVISSGNYAFAFKKIP